MKLSLGYQHPIYPIVLMTLSIETFRLKLMLKPMLRLKDILLNHKPILPLLPLSPTFSFYCFSMFQFNWQIPQGRDMPCWMEL